MLHQTSDGKRLFFEFYNRIDKNAGYTDADDPDYAVLLNLKTIGVSTFQGAKRNYSTTSVY